MSRSGSRVVRRKDPLRVGFLPVSDCAPLVYASEAGLFEKYEVEVELQRETSWPSIRDKIIEGNLDAAHAPATLPFLANVGLDSDPCACVSGLVLSLEGNAIMVSSELWAGGVRDAESLRAAIYRNWGKRTYTFGVIFSLSPQEILLRQWLGSAGIVPGRDVRIVAVPPAEVFPTLKLGYLDGYCVGEPWSTLAVQAGAGVCVATSAELAPGHPEKVLMVRHSFAVGHADEHERMIAAILEGCAFCDQPENRPLISRMLSHRQYLNAPEEAVKTGLAGPFDPGGPREQRLLNLTVLHGHNANDPDDGKARWLMDSLAGMLSESVFQPVFPRRAPIFKNVFRRDIYERGKAALVEQTRKVEAEAKTFEDRARKEA